MTIPLNQEDRKALVDYRLEKAAGDLIDAKILAENSRYDNAVTRLYYACFHAASALLIHHGIEVSSHRAIKRMLSLYFIKTGLLPHKMIIIYADLLNGRQLSDYEDFVYQDKESYDKYLSQAKEFIQEIKRLIAQNNPPPPAPPPPSHITIH